jgi:hypothetical protein
MGSNGLHWDVAKLRKNSDSNVRLQTCFKCHEIADIIVVSQVVTRKVWIHVAIDYEESEIKKKVTEEYYMCGICGRTLFFLSSYHF